MHSVTSKQKTGIMKKSIMYVMAIITVSTFLLIEVCKEEKMSDIALANVEALADDELADNQYFCYGVGKVTCPYSGKQVAGYYIKRNIK